MKVLVLLSGGLDSAVVLATCLAQGHECSTIGFLYGQPHEIELDHAERIARHYKVPFDFWETPTIPLVDDVVFAGRNLLFAATAIAIAQSRNLDAIAVGCNATDWVRFPDCRPGFWQSVRAAAAVYGILVLTPLLHHPKSEVVAQAYKLKVPIDLTWSCYSPKGDEPCGHCLACKTRKEALECQPCSA